MRNTRALRLNRESLAELTPGQLVVVAGAAQETRDERCISGIVRCTTDVLTEKLSLRTC